MVLRIRKSDGVKMAELMSDSFMLIMVNMTKYQIAMQALLGYLLEPPDIKRFAERVAERSAEEILLRIKERGRNVNRVALHEFAQIIEDAVESEARLVGKWEDNPPHFDINEDAETRQRIDKLFRKYGIDPVL